MDQSWQDAVANIVSLCFELNQTVSVIVNNSSPEGHLPMDLEALSLENGALAEREMVTPQMVLLCSWRTVKEVSQLFGLFATKASIRTDVSASGLLTDEQVRYMHIRAQIHRICDSARLNRT